MNIIILPWPPKECNPNKRLHWSVVAKAKAKYRRDCRLIASQLRLKSKDRALLVLLVFHPPDRRRRDRDNMLASIKGGIDGISDAIGVDDSHFVLKIATGDPVKGGAVVVTITEDE